MLLKLLKLKNLRTYETGEISFPEGVMLFEGGIGSGKSTILLAIEFALFGLGNERGTTLLSLGKNSGDVELTFVSNGKEMTVHRSLTRTKRGAGIHQGAQIPGGVKQDDCWIEVDGRRITLSPKEMKERVLMELNYNEPQDPKARSVIFRYAIYTPQEEMKEILAQSPDQRLQTIRKALRLEDYKIARDNAQMIAKDMKKRADFLNERAGELGRIENEVEVLKARVPAISKELDDANYELIDVENNLSESKKIRGEVQARLQELAGGSVQAEEVTNELRIILKEISNLNMSIESDEARIKELNSNIKNLNLAAKPQMSDEDCQSMLDDARKRLSDCNLLLGRHNHSAETYAMLIENGMCPTCRRLIDGAEFERHLEDAQTEFEATLKVKKDTEKEIQDLEKERRSVINYDNNKKKAELLDRMLQDALEKSYDDKEKMELALERKEGLEARKTIAERVAAEFLRLKAESESNDKKIGEYEKKKYSHSIMKTKLEGELEKIDIGIKDLQKEKEKIKADLAKAAALIEYANWLNEYFALALERIETAILTAANIEFDAELNRWFAFLVEDTAKSVRVDEVFTPLVTQDAYEQELDNLSGGERTALALAYRVALNKVVQKNAGIDANLLILDEPTDGFSKDQIGKMGDLLKELNMRQAIIVSHERELEGAVDHIFRVFKDGGKSKIQPLSA